MTRSSNINNERLEEVVPDGGWGWIIVFSSFMIHFIMDGITYSMGDIYLRPMMEIFQSNRARVSIIFGILPAITLISGPVATILVNMYGCRKITVIGACIAALGYLASSLYANIWFYYITIGIIGGIGFGLIYLPAIYSVNFYFEKKRSRALGIAVCGSGLGTMAFPWIMPFVMNSPMWFDYDGALMTESAFILMCVIFGILMIPLPREASEKRRVALKLRAAAKQQAQKLTTGADIEIDIDEQNCQLLPNQESTPRQETQESIIVIPTEEQLSADYVDRLSLSKVKQNESPNESYVNNNHDKIFSKSLQHVSPKTVTETPALIACEDAIYQDSLHHNPSSKENIDDHDHHEQMVTTSLSTDKKIKMIPKESLISEVRKQIELKILKDPAFALFAISNFLTSLGFNVPYNFANDLAIDTNIIENRRHWIIMSIGVANCFGRIIIGILGDRKWVNRLILYNITLIVAGLATMAAPLCGSIVYSHMIYASLFGFFSGGYVSLTSVIVGDLVGMDKLSNGLGITYLFQGVATFLGTPIVGAMRDAFSNYSQPYFWPYLIFGGSIVLSGMILFLIPILKRRKERHQKSTKQLDMNVMSYSKQNLST